VSIANAGTALLDWSSVLGPDLTLVNVSAPTVPVIPTAGIYAVSVEASGTTLTPAGYFQLGLELDSDGLDASAQVDSRPASAARPTPLVTVTLVLYIPAAGTLRARVHSFDGASTRAFTLTEATVQRIT
jgi:hypothetical protein